MGSKKDVFGGGRFRGSVEVDGKRLSPVHSDSSDYYWIFYIGTCLINTIHITACWFWGFTNCLYCWGGAAAFSSEISS